MARMKWKSRRGISIVESAFMLPIMLMLVFGAIEFGTLLHLRHTMLHAAREAARAVAVQGLTANAGIQIAQDLLPGEDFDYRVTATAPLPEDIDRDVVIEISVPLSEASLGDMFGFYGNSRMTVSVTMRSEQ
jgi:hypothetical protein